MSGVEIVIVVLGGVASAVSFVNTFITNRRLRKGLEKVKNESKKASDNLEKLAMHLGICEESNNEPIQNSDEMREIKIDTPSEIELTGVKYNKRTKSLILPSDYAYVQE